MSGVTAEKLTKTYLKIRDERAKLSAEFKEKDSTLSRQLDRVKQGLLDYCNAHGVESVRTSEGLFYRSTRQRFWTNDWEKMHAFIMEHGVPELLEKRLNQTNFKQFLEENPESKPEGLNIDSEYSIAVRKK
jgi:hypothetical protein|tara:strand:+ start:77 stop:469 length:393 start_codon:yes stop_codon:yes gene_type:complete